MKNEKEKSLKPNAFTVIGHIRLRPGMYVAQNPEKVIFQELLSNAIDEFIVGKVSNIYINHRGNRITIRDNGSGMSSTQMKQWIQKLFPSKNNNTQPYTLARAGLGLPIAIALSSEFKATTYQADTTITLAATHGKFIPIQNEPNKTNIKSGFEVTVELDNTLFPDAKISATFVREEVKKAVCLYHGLTIFLNGEKMTGTLKDLAEEDVKSVEYFGKLLDFAVVRQSSGCVNFIRSFVNGSETPDGGIHTELIYRMLAEEFSQMPIGLFSDFRVILHLHIPLEGFLLSLIQLRLDCDYHNPPPSLFAIENELREALRSPAIKGVIEGWK